MGAAVLSDALNGMKAALAAALPARVVTRDLKNFDQRKDAELQAGVLTLVAAREFGYANHRGREADMGRLSLAIVGQIKLPGKPAPSTVEDAEFAFAAEVKTFLAGALPVSDALLLETRFSGQLEAPYGWFAMDVEVRP